MNETKRASCPRYIEETPVRRRLASTAGGDPLFAHCRSRRFPSFAEKLQNEGPDIPFPRKRGEKRLRSYMALCATEGHESRVSDPRRRRTRIGRAVLKIAPVLKCGSDL